MDELFRVTRQLFWESLGKVQRTRYTCAPQTLSHRQTEQKILAHKKRCKSCHRRNKRVKPYRSWDISMYQLFMLVLYERLQQYHVVWF
jgi:hypothetical protein